MLYRIPDNRVRRAYRGGRELDRLAGVAAPADGDRPEDWILSTVAAVNPGMEPRPGEGLSRLELPDGTVTTLAERIARAPEATLGAAHWARHGAAPAFLLKFLDSSIRLHLQCHPTVEFSRRHLNADHGKAEGYVILATRAPDAYVYLGFQRPPTPEEWKREVEAQDVAAMLSHFDRVPVRPGDMFYVPGGIPHAIGEGVTMIEIMEPSDFAVRLEFEREGVVLPESARFMGRGVDFAVSMFDFRAWDLASLRRELFVSPRPLPAPGGGGELASCFDERYTPFFRLWKLTTDGASRVPLPSFAVVIVTEGRGVIAGAAEGRELPAKRGDRFFVEGREGGFAFAAAGGPATAVVALPPA